MEKIKLSRLIIMGGEKIIKDAKKVNGKYLVKLEDGKWYSLEEDIIQLDAQGNALMALIKSLAGGD